MTGQRDTSSGELFSPDEVVSLLIDDDGLEQQFAAQQKAAGGSGAPAEKPHHIALRMTDGDEEAEKDEDDEDVEGDDDNDGEREGSGAAAGGSGGGGGKEAKVAGRKRVKAGHGGKSKAAAAPPGALTLTLTLLKSLLGCEYRLLLPRPAEAERKSSRAPKPKRGSDDEGGTTPITSPPFKVPKVGASLPGLAAAPQPATHAVVPMQGVEAVTLLPPPTFP